MSKERSGTEGESYLRYRRSAKVAEHVTYNRHEGREGEKERRSFDI
jgi:hypothetical protein